MKGIHTKQTLPILMALLLMSVATLADGAQSPDGRWTLDLSGPRWQMEGIRPGQGEIEGFQRHSGSVAGSAFNWNGAEVPGDVYTDLWRAGEIDDPHYGRNGMKAKWATEREWWYRGRWGRATFLDSHNTTIAPPFSSDSAPPTPPLRRLPPVPCKPRRPRLP